MNPKCRQTNVCEACGEGFEAGGRSGKKRKARYCSSGCRTKGGTRHPLPRTLAPLDAAYLAGFFDGEGSIIRPKPSAWRLTIYQNDEAVIRWIAETTGTGHVGCRAPAKRNNLVKQPVVARTQWYWNLYGHNAAALLRQLRPYLRVKRERAETMLADFPPD